MIYPWEEGRKVFYNISDKGLISELTNSSISKKQTTQSKDGQKAQTDNSPKTTYKMAGGHMKRCSILLRIRVTQVRTTRCHLTPVRMAIKKSTNNKWRGWGEKGTLLHCRWECKLVQPLWRKVWRRLKKLKIELPYDPVIPLLGTYQEKTMVWKGTSTPAFIAALFTIAQTPSTGEWVKKMWCVYIYTVEYQSLKRMK